MIAALLLALAVAPAMQDSDAPADHAYAERRLSPANVARWRDSGAKICARAYAAAQCETGYMSARYAETGAEICWHDAGQPYKYRHGGTATSGVQMEMRRTCRAAIEHCRASWTRAYALMSRDPQDADKPLDARMRGGLDQICGESAQ
jgi:hypothetical protein